MPTYRRFTPPISFRTFLDSRTASILCRRCEATFTTPTVRGDYPAYCSDDCRREAHREQVAASAARLKRGIRVRGRASVRSIR